MRTLRNLFIGIILGLVAGLWFGVNLGKGKPLLANPFSDRTLKDKLKQTGGELLEKSGDVLEKGEQALKKKLGE